jgi:hypothetical protein
MFDDIAMCNAIGVYKQENNNGNSKGIFDKENSYLQSLTPKENAVIYESKSKFMLYPNPASTTINISYELTQTEKGMVVLYDILGREYLKVDLNSSNNKVIIDISSMNRGIYTYKYMINERQHNVGKLLIE